MPTRQPAQPNGADTLRRLERLEERQTEIIERLTANSGRLTDIQDDLRAVIAEVGGAPDVATRGPRDNLRWRIHQLENSAYAAEYAKEALKAAEAARESANEKQWSIWQKGGLFLFAFIGAIGTLLSLVGHG